MPRSALAASDVLVNNAGMGGPTKPVHELDPADWDPVLRVNLTGAFDVARLVNPASDPRRRRRDPQHGFRRGPFRLRQPQSLFARRSGR